MNNGPSYIESVLTGDERLVFLGRFPWIYKFHALMFLLAGIVGAFAFLGLGIYLNLNTGIGRPLAGGFWNAVSASGGFVTAIANVHIGVRAAAFVALFIGVLLFAKMLIMMLTTEVGVTTYRLIYKTGVIARNVGEMNLARIESIHVAQSILGRLLNYGYVEVRGMGVGDIQLPLLENPLALRRAIELATRPRIHGH